MPEVHKTFSMGEYAYDSLQHKLIPLSAAQPKLEIPYPEHEIANYPFPISWKFSKLQEFSLQPTDAVFPNILVRQVFSSASGSAPRITRLDPLFRRSSVVFSHLGLISKAIQKKQYTHPNVQKALAENRKRVMVQTFGWEIPKWYKLNKTIRRYDDNDLKKAQKAEHRAKQATLTALHVFIETLTEDFNTYLETQKTSTSITVLVKKWKIILLQKSYTAKFKIPEFIDQDSINTFLDLMSTYLQELIYLEKHIENRSLRGGDIFTYTLAAVGEREVLARDDTDGALEIIDADLIEGAHAEVRLFYQLILKNKRLHKNMPYFGITQLCCACCNTLFKANNLNYSQGSMHRAGTQATYFSNWMIDPKMRTEAVLRPFLGTRCFILYSNLVGEIKIGSVKQSRKALACDIIEELAILWFKASPERLEQLKQLGFDKGAIVREGSPYPNVGQSPALVSKESAIINSVSHSKKAQTVSSVTFRESLSNEFGLAINWISPDGDCQFRSIVRALEQLDPARYAALQEMNFAFFGANDEQQKVNFLRRTTVKHISDNSAEFEPFLANEIGVGGFQVGQDLVFANIEEYAAHMKEPGEYGDHLTLRAITQYLGRSIIVLQPGIAEAPVDVHIITEHPGAPLDIQQAIVLVFNGIDHYEVVLHQPGVPFTAAFNNLITEKYNGNMINNVDLNHK